MLREIRRCYCSSKININMLKINEEFQKNKNETSEENIKEMLKVGRAVETILRENVMQGEHVEQNKILLRPARVSCWTTQKQDVTLIH
uniref:LYR motif containing 7 n=1 Tax=Sinocyclocheilus rhinocerous TaxID=307959 RepID=A0A673JMQ5_9TELE